MKYADVQKNAVSGLLNDNLKNIDNNEIHCYVF